MSHLGERKAIAPPLRVLLSGLIDYAGLFPPASRSMASAVADYGKYLASDARWALGRFIVPASRLAEFRDALSVADAEPNDWQVSAILAEAADMELVRAHNEAAGKRAGVDCVEMRAPDVAAVERLAALPPRFERYAELPVDSSLPDRIAAVAARGLAAKIRTGGVTFGAFPAPAAVLDFLARCRDAHVPLKATAGLHHVLGGEYALTYEPASATGTMFGLLNVVVCAALVFAGAEPDVAGSALEERRIESFQFGTDSLRYRGNEVSIDTLRAVRRDLLRAVGSCSFREPLDELTSFGLL